MTEPQRYSDYHCSIIDRIYRISGRGWFGRWRLKLAVLGAICLIILAGGPSEYSYAETTVDEVMGVTPFSSEDSDMVKNGKTVSTELIKVADRELAIGVACLIKEDGRDESSSLESIIARSLGFPNDDEFQAHYARMDTLRSQELQPADGTPDIVREGVRLRISVAVIE